MMEIKSRFTHFSDRNNDEKHKLITIFTVVIASVIFLSGFNGYILGDTNAALISALMVSLVCLNFLFLRIFSLHSCVIYLFSIAGFTIFYFDSYAGLESGSFIFYFPFLLTIANVFSYRDKKERHLLYFFLFYTISLALVNLFTSHTLFQNSTIAPENKHFVFSFNFMLALFSLIYFVYLIIQSNLTRYELLQEKADEQKKLFTLEKKKNIQNEFLLAEMQHRLKNNLSLMSALLKMKLEDQAILNPDVAIKESVHAIQVVAQANYLQIFQENIIVVPLLPFTEDIISYWNELFKESKIIGEATIESFEIEMCIKQIIPMGLIVHEFLSIYWQECQRTNSEEKLHILIQEEKEIISMKFYSSIANLELKYPSKSQLIDALIDQIDGSLTVITAHEFMINIPMMKNSPKIESAVLFE